MIIVIYQMQLISLRETKYHDPSMCRHLPDDSLMSSIDYELHAGHRINDLIYTDTLDR